MGIVDFPSSSPIFPPHHPPSLSPLLKLRSSPLTPRKQFQRFHFPNHPHRKQIPRILRSRISRQRINLLRRVTLLRAPVRPQTIPSLRTLPERRLHLHPAASPSFAPSPLWSSL